MLNLAQAAERLGVSVDTARRLVKSGELESFNAAPMGSRLQTIRVSPEAIASFIARRSKQTKQTKQTAKQRGRSSAEGVVEFF